ncbi:MAG: hypothetical protein IH820_17635 [Bacteroidetes bacterium]|nr:hypothetical protein [Bacteroidota bacterium]
MKFKITNKTDRELSGLRVEATLQGRSHPAVRTFSVAAGATTEIGLTPVFDKVSQITERQPAAIHTKLVGQDGKILHELTKSVTLLSKNDVYMSDSLWILSATMVTPNDPMVDQLVAHAANRAPERKIAGYQRDANHVLAEVQAVYDTVAALGVHYRSNTTSFLDSKKLTAQRVTFPAESIQGTGANCLDGAILFASAFENMGLNARIVLVPGHAMVAVDLEQKDGSTFCVIETTMVGTHQFRQAYVRGAQTYNSYAEKGQCFLLSVKVCRENGITPFPYPLGVTRFPVERLRPFLLRGGQHRVEEGHVEAPAAQIAGGVERAQRRVGLHRLPQLGIEAEVVSLSEEDVAHDASKLLY